MSILEIKSIEKIEDDYYQVIALIEDSVMVFPGNMIDPPEYGEAFCEASFYLEDGEELPENEQELIRYLEKLDLDWQTLPKDWDY